MRDPGEVVNAVMEDKLPLEEERSMVEACIKKNPEMAAPLLTLTLNQKHLHKEAGRALREEMNQPPLFPARFLGCHAHQGQPRAKVAAGGRHLSVGIAPGVETGELTNGCLVFLNSQMNMLLGLADIEPGGGEVAAITRVLGSRVRLKGASGDDFLGLAAAPLVAQLEEGQEVIFERETGVVYEILPFDGERFEVLEELQPVITIKDLGGLEDFFLDLVENVSLPLLHPGVCAINKVKPMKGVVFSGPPGVGKSSMVQAVAAHLRTVVDVPVRVLVLPPGGHRSKWFGDAEKLIKLVFSEAKRAAKKALVLLVFDDFDHLGSRDDSVVAVHDSKLIPCFLQAIDQLDPARDRVVLFGISNRVDLLDAALMRRFAEQVYAFSRPSRAATREIFEKLLVTDLPYAVNGHDVRGEIIERAVGSLFAANGENRPLATITFRDNSRREISAADVLNGALLATSVESAKRTNALRMARGDNSGLTAEDVLAALDRRLNDLAGRMAVGPALYQMLDIPRDRDVVHLEVHPTRRAAKSFDFIIEDQTWEGASAC